MSLTRALSSWFDAASARWGALPRDLKVVTVAAVIVLAGFATALAFMVPNGDDDTEADSSAVAARSTGGRLLFGVDQVDLGASKVSNGRDVTQWRGLHRTEGRADLSPNTIVSLASGQVDIEPINEVRFTFRSAAYVKDGILHELIIPQDTLRLRIPGETGAPGDTLLVTFDVGRSVSDEAGLLIFRPFVSEAYWLKPPSPDETAAADPNAGNKSTDPVTPESFSYESPSGTQGPGGAGGSGGSGGMGGMGGDGTQAQVGRASFFVRDAAKAIESLNTTFTKLGIQQSDDRVSTYFEGSKMIDLRQYDGPEDRAHLVTFQLPAGDYEAIHLEFGHTDSVIARIPQQMSVPQPHLVLEQNFSIRSGQTLEFLMDFDLDQSANPSGDGWEFRPVVGQLQLSTDDQDDDKIPDTRDADDDGDGIPDNKDKDRDGDGKLDARPSQYRTGGSVMPSVGKTNSYYVQSSTGRDPDETANNAGEAATGGRSRPVDQEAAETVTGAAELFEQPGVAIQTSNGQDLYIIQALSTSLLPSGPTLAVLNAQEVSRLNNLPVMLVVGPSGIGPDLASLPGVTHVQEDVGAQTFR